MPIIIVLILLPVIIPVALVAIVLLIALTIVSSILSLGWYILTLPVKAVMAMFGKSVNWSISNVDTNAIYQDAINAMS